MEVFYLISRNNFEGNPMKHVFLVLAALITFSIPALANHTAGHPATDHIVVDVNGLVCDFCARALEKVFYQREGVEGVNVDLNNHLVTLDLAHGTNISDEEITKLITDAGYNVTAIKRGE